MNKREAALITISMPPEIKEQLKRAAEQEQRTLSNFSALLLREALAKREPLAA